MYQTKHHRFSGYAVHYLCAFFFTPPAPDCYCIKGDSEDKKNIKEVGGGDGSHGSNEEEKVAAEEKEEAAVG